MKRIGLTQRVVQHTRYPETRDCLDQNWARLITHLGWLPLPLSNAVEPVGPYLDALALDGVILTGGNDLCSQSGGEDASPLRDRFEDAVLDHAHHQGLPVLGVCRGLQLINHHFGGRTRRVVGHVAQRHTVQAQLPGMAAPRSREVNSYHGWGLETADLAPVLTATGTDADGSIEALSHPQAPIHGIMWHPEREDPHDPADLALLRHLFGAQA